jgi:hypothetical protein
MSYLFSGFYGWEKRRFPRLIRSRIFLKDIIESISEHPEVVSGLLITLILLGEAGVSLIIAQNSLDLCYYPVKGRDQCL